MAHLCLLLPLNFYKSRFSRATPRYATPRVIKHAKPTTTIVASNSNNKQQKQQQLLRITHDITTAGTVFVIW